MGFTWRHGQIGPSQDGGVISVCPSSLRVENLHMVVVEQVSRRMVYLSDGNLEIYLRLDEVQLRLGKHDL